MYYKYFNKSSQSNTLNPLLPYFNSFLNYNINVLFGITYPIFYLEKVIKDNSPMFNINITLVITKLSF